MVTLRQLPARIDIEMIQGDSLAVPLNFDPSTLPLDGIDMDLTGFKIEAPIYRETRVIAPWNPNGAPMDGDFIFEFALSNVDLPAGRIAVSLRNYETIIFHPEVTYRWYLRFRYPNQFVRTMVSGKVKVFAP